MSNFFRHWGLVNAHRYHVFRNGVACGIGWHCLFHDLSKYTPREFFRSVKYFDGTHSPVYEERLKNDYFSFICQAHTRRNKHHWEYWTDFFLGRIVARDMPWIYATEYVCDMLSASYCYDPKHFSPEKTLEYYQKRCDHYYMSDLTREYVRFCLTRFRDHGFAGLKKKDTKAEYRRLQGLYPRVRVYETLLPAGTLPRRGEGSIMQQSLQVDEHEKRSH